MTQETIQARLNAIKERMSLNETQLASYVGVPVHTLHKWCTGQRIPSAVVHKLLDVLGTIEAVNPALHATFLPDKG